MAHLYLSFFGYLVIIDNFFIYFKKNLSLLEQKMKRLTLLILFAALAVFADPYDSDDYGSDDYGSSSYESSDDSYGSSDESSSESAAPAPAVESDCDEDEDDCDSPKPAAAPAKKVASNDDCDEYDDDCDDDDDEYDVKGDVSRTNRIADDRDYAASEASENATDRFGIADEVRFWSAVALSAVAVGGAVLGIYNHMKANEASDAYDNLAKINEDVMKNCNGNKNCEAAVSNFGTNKDQTWSVADLQNRMSIDKKTQDSYSTFRNVWFGVSAASLTAAIVLFVW